MRLKQGIIFLLLFIIVMYPVTFAAEKGFLEYVGFTPVTAGQTGFIQAVTLPSADDGFLSSIYAPAPSSIPIRTAEELYVSLSQNPSGSYCLVNDIDLSGYQLGQWTPIENFSGILDGQGYTISNLNVPEMSFLDETGLFATASNCKILNLKVTLAPGGQLSGTKKGLLIGAASGESVEIQNCIVEGSLSHSSANPSTALVCAGGLVGSAESQDGASLLIENSIFRGALHISDSASCRLGGFLGRSSGFESTIKNCIVQGELTLSIQSAMTCTGGLIGESYQSSATIENCALETTVCAQTDSKTFEASAGGLVGRCLNVSVKNTCVNSDVTAKTSHTAIAGGILGSIHPYGSAAISIINCYMTGSVLADGTRCYQGGLVGFLNNGNSSSKFVIQKSYAYATLNGSGLVITCSGGLVGSSTRQLQISESFSLGNISSIGETSCYAGGIAGYLTGGSQILGCWSVGNITAHSTGLASASPISCAGGLVGGQERSPSTIKLCYAQGAVTALANGTGSGCQAYAGGLVGSDDLTTASTLLENSYHTGPVQAQLSSTVSESYAGAGGLLGTSSVQNNINGLQVTNCYHTGDVSAQGSTAYTGGLLGGVTSPDSPIFMVSSYHRGSVSASSTGINGPDPLIGTVSGGLVGYGKFCSFSNCVAAAAVASSGATPYCGGLVGNGYRAAVDLPCYYQTAPAMGMGSVSQGMAVQTTDFDELLPEMNPEDALHLYRVGGAGDSFTIFCMLQSHLSLTSDSQLFVALYQEDGRLCQLKRIPVASIPSGNFSCICVSFDSAFSSAYAKAFVWDCAGTCQPLTLPGIL